MKDKMSSFIRTETFNIHIQVAWKRIHQRVLIVRNIQILFYEMWKFVKELVILFHRMSAAPWGHVVSTIKKRAPTGDSFSFFHSHAVCNRSIRSSP